MTIHRTSILWAGLLTGPVIWFIGLEAKFALAPWVCAYGWRTAVFAVSFASLAITAAAGALSWMQWRQLPAGTRPRAMALGGMALSAGVVLVLLAQSLPEWILRGCE